MVTRAICFNYGAQLHTERDPRSFSLRTEAGDDRLIAGHFFSSINWPRWPITRCAALANLASSHGNVTSSRTEPS